VYWQPKPACKQFFNKYIKIILHHKKNNFVASTQKVKVIDREANI